MATSCPRMAELKAQVAHLENDRKLLWNDRKHKLRLVEELDALVEKLKRDLATEKQISCIIESRARESLYKQDEEIAFLKKALAYQQEMRTCEQKQHGRELTAAYKALQRTEDNIQRMQADCLELESRNQQLLAELEGLKKQSDYQSFRIAECEQVIASQQATLAARPPVSPWAPSAVKPKPWSLPAQNAKITELVAETEKLTEQLASAQQQNDELLQQSQQLQVVLNQSEIDEWELGMVNKRVADLEVKNLLLELDNENATASNHQLQGLVEELQSQLQNLQAKYSNLDQQQQAVAVCDPVAVVQASLKPVAVSSSSSSHDSQPDQPDTPEVIDVELSVSSCPSSSQISRRNSDVSQPGSPESCSSRCSVASGSSTSSAMERINSLHPLYRYCSWVQDNSSAE